MTYVYHNTLFWKKTVEVSQKIQNYKWNAQDKYGKIILVSIKIMERR